MSHPKIVTKPEFCEIHQMWFTFSNSMFLDTVWHKSLDEANRTVKFNAERGCRVVDFYEPIVEAVKLPWSNKAEIEARRAAGEYPWENMPKVAPKAQSTDEFAFLDGSAARRNPVALRGDALDSAAKWSEDKIRKLYLALPDARLETANAWLKVLEAKGYTRAQAQLIVFGFLSHIHNKQSGKVWMANFTEKMHEQLVDKVSAFGGKAYPLTDKQFDAAVKAAW